MPDFGVGGIGEAAPRVGEGGWRDDFTFRAGRVQVKKTGADLKLDAVLLGECLLWFAYHVMVLGVAIVAFPLWLASVQAVVIPVTDDQGDYAKGVAAELRAAGLRVQVDGRGERMGYKIREAQGQKVPYMFVVGKKEAADPAAREKVQVALRPNNCLWSER